MLLLQRERAAFPAGRRWGFNPGHIAVSRLGCRYSCVAVPGNILNLLQGKPGVMTGSFTNKIIGSVGPVVFANSNNQSTISGLSTFNPTNGSLGLIFSHDGSASGNKGLCNGQVVPFYQTTLKIFFTNSSNVLDLGVTLTANRFYFLLISWNSNVLIKALIVDLTTGVSNYTTQGIVGNSTVAEGATDVIPSGNAGATVGYNLAAIAYTYKLMDQTEMARWGADPWAFWYPQS